VETTIAVTALRSAGLALLSIVLFAGQAGAQSYDASKTHRFVSDLFANLFEYYERPLTAEEAAIAALDGLSAIDPRFDASGDAMAVRLQHGDTVIAALPAPSLPTAKRWATLASEAIDLGRIVSKQLRSADEETLFRALAEGALAPLDRFSRYAGRRVASEQRASRDGFGGVGVRIDPTDRGVRVVSVIEQTPAKRAGLRAEDLLTHADGRSLRGLNQDDVVALLRGRVHSPLRLTFLRGEDRQARTVRLRREQIFLPTVRAWSEDGVRVVEISGFNQHTTAAVADALRGAARRDRGVVVDLRGNPGGLLDQAVGVADLFIDAGRLLTTKGRHPDSGQIYDAARGDIVNGLPIAVVVDGGSASAAEILAAALQDSGRAVAVGAATFGKGSVQTVVQLPNQGELTLTWARLHAPSGYSFHKTGVLPQLCVTAADAMSDAVLFDAARLYAPMAERARRSGRAQAARDACTASTAAAGDAALRAAMRIAGSPALYAQAATLSARGDKQRTLRAAR